MTTETSSAKSRFGCLYFLRLFAFAAMIFVCCLPFIVTWVLDKQVDAYMQLAPSKVIRPDDLPFEMEEVTFSGGEGISLAGWYVPSQNGAVIIMLHGYGANRTEIFSRAEILVDAGYGVLLYDLRGHGESGGERRSLGWEDIDDVPGALDFVRDQPGVDSDRIGIFGFSIGGQIALRAAAKYPEIKAIFVDGPAPANFDDFPSTSNWRERLFFPRYEHGIDMLSDRLGVPIPESVVDVIGTIAPRPIMIVVTESKPILIPGGEFRVANRYMEAAGDNAQLWRIPEAGHGGGFDARPDEYAEKLVTFFDQALLGD